jgi:hypothetical protein
MSAVRNFFPSAPKDGKAESVIEAAVAEVRKERREVIGNIQA